MIKIILIALVISLTACGKKEDVPYGYSSPQPKFETICLDGVEYWYSPKFNFTPSIKIDSNTLQPSLCK